ncbi:MAG: HD domain-containing protein [Candidatus Methanofastidiosia archaeon]
MFERKLSREEMELLRQIEKFVRHKHSTSEGHDYSHVLQVTKYAIEIAKNIEERVDPFILICGALFHDIGRIGTITGVLHGFRGAGTATGYLRACGVEDEVIEKVGRVVIRHTRTSMMSPERSGSFGSHRNGEGIDRQVWFNSGYFNRQDRKALKGL